MSPAPAEKPQYVAPEPVEENPPLIEEPDLRPLWSISQVVIGREDLKLDELEQRVAALEARHGSKR